MKWYTGTAIFRHFYKNKDRIPQYEVRTTIVAASNEKEAEDKFLNEFSQYATEGTVFLGQYEIKETYDRPGKEPIEVASHMRVSPMHPDDFINKYWTDLRPKSCSDRGWKHVWHQMDESTLSCYNCEQTKKGKLKKS